MALVEKQKTIKLQIPQLENLTKDEYEFLFAVLKDMNFKGHQVETLYNLIIKLQKNYLETTTKK
jgi:hypothetical protein